MNLQSLFASPDGFRFSMKLERGSVSGFFSPSVAWAEIVRQRSAWLRSQPGRYAALLPEGEFLLKETISLALEHQTITAAQADWIKAGDSPLEQCIRLGELWEADFLLMRREADSLKLA